MSRKLTALFLILFSSIASAFEDKSTINANSSTAFVTLLYGEDFLLGVRVLGQSIKKYNTNSDMVVIATGKLPEASIKTLKNDGWITKIVGTIQNPAKGPQPTGYPERFSAVYTKLSIFNLTEYNKVVYMDADTIIVGNIDTLFECPGFCATLRHSERMNSGVMVVTPSKDLFEDMISKTGILQSYTGGDQGFLNSYFSDFAKSGLFESGKEYPPDTKILRLPTAYNADIGLYLLNSNKWMIPKDDLRIIHYTLGPFKPWNWWTSWLIHEVHIWQKYRDGLPRDANGYKKGMNYIQHFATTYMFYIPILILLVLFLKIRHSNLKTLFSTPAALLGSNNGAGAPGVRARLTVPKKFTGLSIFFGYASLLIPLTLVLLSVPTQIPSIWGWLLTYEWTLFLHFLLFGIYLKISYQMGRYPSSSHLPSAKAASGPGPWNVTLKSIAIGTCLLVLCPWVSNILHIKSFLATLAVTLISSVITFVYLTHIYATLPIRWFAWGRTNLSTKTDLDP